MSNVIPFKRAVSNEQCRQSNLLEWLIVGQTKLWFAWARSVNRIWWGA